MAESYSGWMRLGFFNHPSADQKGGVCNAKYPTSWIVNIAAQMISIRIKARALNWVTPPQEARTVAPREHGLRHPHPPIGRFRLALEHQNKKSPGTPKPGLSALSQCEKRARRRRGLGGEGLHA